MCHMLFAFDILKGKSPKHWKVTNTSGYSLLNVQIAWNI